MRHVVGRLCVFLGTWSLTAAARLLENPSLHHVVRLLRVLR
jgi:hypothetical protein